MLWVLKWTAFWIWQNLNKHRNELILFTTWQADPRWPGLSVYRAGSHAPTRRRATRVDSYGTFIAVIGNRKIVILELNMFFLPVSSLTTLFLEYISISNLALGYQFTHCTAATCSSGWPRRPCRRTRRPSRYWARNLESPCRSRFAGCQLRPADWEPRSPLGSPLNGCGCQYPHLKELGRRSPWEGY